MLGFRGHFLTKARRYSVTLGAVRTARVRYRTNLAVIARRLNGGQLIESESTLVIGAFAFAGVGRPGLLPARWPQGWSAP